MSETTTPADSELHAASTRLWRLIDGTTPGPWVAVVDDHGRGEIDASVWADAIGYYVTEKISSGERHTADAAYIAAMGPNLGVALWGLLRAAHRAAKSGRLTSSDPIHGHALAVARAILAGGGR